MALVNTATIYIVSKNNNDKENDTNVKDSTTLKHLIIQTTHVIFQKSYLILLKSSILNKITIKVRMANNTSKPINHGASL